MAVGSDTGPAQDATLQAIIVALGGPILGMPNGSGTGLAQDASLQQILALIGGGGSLPATAHTVLGGATYAIALTDGIILFDSSNGLRPIAQLPAGGAGLFVDRTITFVWVAWNGAQVPPEIDGNGNSVVAFSGMPASATYVATTNITTPGAAYTLKWDGANWVPA
jgi:hypothetical protein